MKNIITVAAEMQKWLELVTLTKNPTDMFSGINVLKVKAWVDVLAAQSPPVGGAVDDAMVERACVADWGQREWDAAGNDKRAAERIIMRGILRHALAALPASQPPAQVSCNVSHPADWPCGICNPASQPPVGGDDLQAAENALAALPEHVRKAEEMIRHKFYEEGMKVAASIYTHPAPQDAKVGADAARYRFLRDVGPPDSDTGYPTILQWELVTQNRNTGALLFGEDLDRAIDTALAALAEGK